MKTCDKRQFSSEAHAQAALEALIHTLKRDGKAQDTKYLNAYLCACGYWHHGRSFKTRRKETAFREPKPATKKVPSWGQLMRHYQRILKADDRKRNYMIAEIGKIVAKDMLELQQAAEQREANRFRAAELLDSIQQAEHIA
jgi:hypothetical protein